MGYIEDLRGKKQGQGRPRWRARYRDPSGRERSKSFARKVDAEQFLVSIEDAKLRGVYVDPQLGRVAFGEWAERWFRTTAGLKPASRRTYRKLLDYQILPAFERATLGGIDTLAVREWVTRLVEQGLSPSRIRNAHQVLSQILAAGVEGGRIARNPAAGVRLPRIVRRDMHFLTARQVEDLAAAIDPRYGLLVRFAAYTGLRAGELVALRVRHLNLLRGRCEVGESATEVVGSFGMPSGRPDGATPGRAHGGGSPGERKAYGPGGLRASPPRRTRDNSLTPAQRLGGPGQASTRHRQGAQGRRRRHRG